jgi:hypothetical protein
MKSVTSSRTESGIRSSSFNRDSRLVTPGQFLRSGTR